VSGSELVEALGARAVEASDFLKVLSHEGRLRILCHLATRERSVTELEGLSGARQAAASRLLALRLEGFVLTRREGGTIFCAISDPRVLRRIRLMPVIFSGTATG